MFDYSAATMTVSSNTTQTRGMVGRSTDTSDKPSLQIELVS